MNLNNVIIVIMILILSGCATSSVVMLENGVKYPPNTNAQILANAPSRNFKTIAMIEARGPVNTPLPDLLESMKQKASQIGADAVIPTEDASTHQQQGIMYNPWLGGYQTFGGGSLPVIRGYAIKYVE